MIVVPLTELALVPCTLLRPYSPCSAVAVFCFAVRWSAVGTAFFRFRFDLVIFEDQFCFVLGLGWLTGKFAASERVELFHRSRSATPVANPRSALSDGLCVFPASRFLKWSFLLSAVGFSAAFRGPLYVCRSSSIADTGPCFRCLAAPLSGAAARSLNASLGSWSKCPPSLFLQLAGLNMPSVLCQRGLGSAFWEFHWHALLLQTLSLQICSLLWESVCLQ